MRSIDSMTAVRICILSGVLGLLLAAGGCSGDGLPTAPKSPNQSSPYSTYSIKVIAGDGRRVNVPPVPTDGLRIPLAAMLPSTSPPNTPGVLANAPVVPEPVTPSSHHAGSGTASKPPSHTATVDYPDGSADLPSGSFYDATAWALVYGAGFECDAPRLSLPAWAPRYDGTAAYSIFLHAPTDCDTNTLMQQALLCIAQKLSDVADAVAPIKWSKVPDAPTNPVMPPGPWTIPPQAEKDKFVAREVAIHLLATLALTDVWPIQMTQNGTPAPAVCTTAYATLEQEHKSSTLNTASISEVFGLNLNDTPQLPPLTPLTTATLNDVVEARLTFKAGILRGASQLLHDLIGKATYADEAGAAVQKQAAADPVHGMRLFWGTETDADQPYNSLAHVARTLAGRWELGWLVTELGAAGELPCATVGGVPVGPMGLVKSGMPADVAAREGDLPVRTKGQEVASKLIDRAGIVLPSNALSGGVTSGVRDAIKDQLRLKAATLEGLQDNSDFQTKQEGLAINSLVDSLAPEDLAFGLEKSLTAYRELAATQDLGTQVEGGLRTEAAAGALSALGGVALSGGVPRGNLAADIQARMGGVQAGSECNAWPYGWLSAISADGDYLGLFQDSFMLGDVLRRRMVALREDALTVAGMSQSSDAVGVASSMAAATRTWSGAGRIIATSSNTSPAGQSAPDRIDVFLEGFNPKDLGVNTADAMQHEVEVVYGPPWVADCAARIRTGCPDNFENDYVASPTTTAVQSIVGPWKRFLGSDGVLLQVTFQNFAGKAHFSPVYVGTELGNEHLYVIAKHDPAAPNSHGIVLGAMELRAPNAATEVMASEGQHEYFTATFGVPKSNPDHGLDPGDPDQTTASPPSFCIDGVFKEPFVPLENELTSDSDQYENSWKHYLTLAQSAADHADELGKELIDVGLQRDLRKEAAGEEFADQCGDYTDMSAVKISDDGTVAPSADDAEFNACVHDTPTDVVFLTALPPALAPLKDASDSDTAATDWIRANVLYCDTGNDSPLCDKAEHPHISYDSLGLAEYAGGPAAPDSSECSGVPLDVAYDMFNAGYLSKAKTDELSGRPWVSSQYMQAVASQARIEIANDSNWRVLLSGTPIMDSDPSEAPDLWPACIAAQGGCTKYPGHLLNLIFGADGATGGALDSGTRAKLLWRVEGALTFIGKLGGTAPAGLVRGYVPAYNWSIGTDVNVAIPIAYGPKFIYAGSALDYYTLYPMYRTDNDVAIIGQVHPVNPGFDFTFNGAPSWLTTVYRPGQPAGALLNVPAVSEKLEGGGSTNLGNIPGPPNTGSYVSWVGRAFGGIQCSSMTEQHDEYDEGRRDVGEVISPPNHAWTCSSNGGNSGIKAKYDVANGVVSIPSQGTYTGDVGFVTASDTEGSFCEPSACTPGDRMRFFINTYLPKSECEAAGLFTESLALACVMAVSGAVEQPTAPPEIKTVEDIALLEAWYAKLGDVSARALSRLYLEEVPERVVKDFQTGSVGTGANAGANGQLVLQMESAIQGIAGGWARLAGDNAQISGAIRDARYKLRDNDLLHEEGLKQLALQRFEAYSKIAHGLAEAIGGFNQSSGIEGVVTKFNPVTAASGAALGATDIFLGQQEVSTLDDIQGIKDKEAENQTLETLNNLQTTTGTLFSESQAALTDLRKAVADTLQTSVQLHHAQSKAQYEAAKASGAPFVEIDGQKVDFPVNYVLNNQYELTRRRYEKALWDAKYLTYVAQIAIEQRLGIRLCSLTDPVDPVGTPSTWCNDLCKMTGIDYSTLDSTQLPGLDADAGLAGKSVSLADFADPYIGDYVDRLNKFVEGYNLKYPSHDGDDTAVLSLRDDLLGPAGTCTRQASNLLLYSGDLAGSDTSAGDDGGTTMNGWQHWACNSDDQRCLSVDVAAAMADPPAPPEVTPVGGVTWLHEVDPAKIVDPKDKPGGTPDMPVARISYQDVELEGGTTYVLTWWDEARGGTDGAPGAAPAYYVAVYADDWSQVAIKSIEPQAPLDSGSATWSPRRSMQIAIQAPGTYHVTFAASNANQPTPGSVAIANVQLEKGSTPSAYEYTTDSRLVADAKCASGSPENFRNAFAYNCDTSGCYHELKNPFLLDTVALQQNASKLTGKVAQGNFNFRHVTLAVNIVGTGVIDCAKDPSPACYGSGYAEYDLVHDAFQAQVINHLNTPDNYFNFGQATINHGKALAAERYITLPVGSADGALLAQPAVQKQEFRGRPLNGAYTLRIYDKPSLAWDHVEDVQLILNYRYWSRIKSSPGSQ